MGYRVAVILPSYNMPERADAFAEHISKHVTHPCDMILVDNGSDLIPPAEHTVLRTYKNLQSTLGWLIGLAFADVLEMKNQKKYFAYWFLITSAEFVGEGDTLNPLVEVLINDPNAVGVHPALTTDSTTDWTHLITRGGDQPRRTWMIDNIASLYRAEWFNEIGRFDPKLIYAHGIDLETCYKARKQERSLWVHEGSRIKKVTNIGYMMDRMNMTAEERARLAQENMDEILIPRYGKNYWEKLTTEYPLTHDA